MSTAVPVMLIEVIEAVGRGIGGIGGGCSAPEIGEYEIGQRRRV